MNQTTVILWDDTHLDSRVNCSNFEVMVDDKKLPQRIAVLGLGMLGSALMKQLNAAGCTTTGYDLPDWDITNAAHRDQAVAGVDAVVNCAAFTNVDGAETAAAAARAVNAEAPAQLAVICRERGVRLIHISTDFVFDGRKEGSYSEEDVVAPLNAYGRTKADGEAAVLAASGEHCVIRVQWTYGDNGANFITKIASLAADRDQIRVVADQTGAPTWTVDMAAAIDAALRQRAEGLYHFAADGYASRFDVAKLIVESLGITCEVLPCRSDEFETPAERPLNSCFDCTRFDRDVGFPRPRWDESLKRFLERGI